MPYERADASNSYINRDGIPVTSAPPAFTGGGTLNQVTPCHKLLDHLARNGGVWELPADGVNGPTTATTTDWVHPRTDHQRTDVRYPAGTRYKFRMLFARQSPGFAATRYSWWPADDAAERHRQSYVGKFECTERGFALWQIGPHDRFAGIVHEIDGEGSGGRVRAVLSGISAVKRKQKIVLEVPTVARSRSQLAYYCARDDAAAPSLDERTKRRKFASGPNSKLAGFFEATAITRDTTAVVAPLRREQPNAALAGIQLSDELTAAIDERAKRMRREQRDACRPNQHQQHQQQRVVSWGSVSEDPPPFQAGDVRYPDFEAPLDVDTDACMVMHPKIYTGMRL
uniref:Uncharacterized protein n=1 Tax=Neobodo designis TaxID=312471 RepID=A0A7S1QME9_NEODS|mmetsp:Transcript_48712/g.150423  ORF Transcript_48712/g.150423 Transcript_48712/m.150423 type:complete len:342 (+) Transcript_48712:154-1179(+)